MEELREEYWKYIRNTIIEAIENVEDYSKIDYMIIKLNLLANMNLMLDSEKEYNDSIEVLRLYKR